ncbi:MAG: hypothetical protein RMJ43_14525, partial [Chloroherpetonaceae bacterium]|nr:hypothetical protein [Chloroherpetonaceae bacterium]
NVALEEITNTRNVLGKVLLELKNHENEPVLIEGRPNWIYPIALVDWYENLPDRSVYANYLAAQRRIGTDAPQVWHDLLKALFLFEIGDLKMGRLSFSRVASHLCGHPEDVCAEALEAMYRGHYIRYDDVRRVYTLWAEGDKAQQLDELLHEKEAEPREPRQEWELLKKITSDKWAKDILTNVPVPVDWGHQEDWKYQERILTRQLLNARHLRELTPRFDAKSIINMRGVWIFLVPENEEDLQFFRQNAAQVLDEAFAGQDYPPTVILAIPQQPLPHLLRNLMLMDYMSLQEGELQEKYGEAFKSRQKLTLQNIKGDMELLRSGMDCIVPRPYRAAVAAEGLAERISGDDAVKLMQRCYKLTYPYSPPGLLIQYKATANNLRSAVAACSRLLASNQMASPTMALQTGVHKDLLNEILKQGAKGAWGLVDRDGRIVPPEVHGLRKAWDHLEQTFGPGRSNVPVQEGLEPLLAPPFGYDFNQVQLLFCAWYGSRRRELILKVDGRTCDFVEEFKEYLDNKHDKWFIGQICVRTSTSLTRVEPDAKEREARNLIRAISDSSRVPLHTAREYLSLLQAHRQNEDYPEELRQELAAAESWWLQEVQCAEKYDSMIEKIENLIKQAQPVSKLKECMEKVRELPDLRHIWEDDWKRPEELHNDLLARMRDRVETDCERCAKLTDQKRYELHRRQLEQLGQHVKEVDNGLAGRVERALRELEENARRLDAQQHDEPLMVEIREMHIDAPLARLRKYDVRL